MKLNLNFEGGVTVSIVSGTVSFSALTEAVTRYCYIIFQSFPFSKKVVQLTLRGHLKIYTDLIQVKNPARCQHVWTKRTCLHAYIRDTRTRTLDFTHPLYCCVAILFVCTWNAWNPRENLTTRLVVHSRVYHSARWCTPHVHTYIVYMCTVPALRQTV